MRRGGLTMEKVNQRCSEDGDCLIWHGSECQSGHPRFSETRGGKVITIQVRRFVYENKTGKPIPNGMKVLMTCETASCICADHMKLVTMGELMRLSTSAETRIRRALAARRTSTLPRKLDWDKVREIRASSESHTSLARKFGVRLEAIWKVRHNKTWREYANNPFAGLIAANDSKRSAA